MARTPQTDTQSVLQHGESVWRYTQLLLSHDTSQFKLPDWFTENLSRILSSLHLRDVIEEYNILHDCGKPYCIEIDEDGRRHFPNHAAVSKETYLKLPDANLAVGNLIGWDMIMHTATADEISAMQLTAADAWTLLVTAFSEIHSNAAMFGGQDSISFKSKWNKLDRRGKLLMRLYF